MDCLIQDDHFETGQKCFMDCLIQDDHFETGQKCQQFTRVAFKAIENKILSNRHLNLEAKIKQEKLNY